MGKVHFEFGYFETLGEDGLIKYYGLFKPKDESGDYYPAADYKALEAKLAALVELIEKMRGQWIHSVHADDCIKAVADAKGTP